jgi:hypothetical protein
MPLAITVGSTEVDICWSIAVAAAVAVLVGVRLDVGSFLGGMVTVMLAVALAVGVGVEIDALVLVAGNVASVLVGTPVGSGLLLAARVAPGDETRASPAANGPVVPSLAG